MLTYFLPLTSSLWCAKDTQLLQFVSQERKRKTKRYIYSIDQRLSLYAALTARMGISQLSKIPFQDLEFSSAANYKPHCISLPHYDFSLSHTKTAILCCISNNQLVGVDVEKIRTPPYTIMPSVFHTLEINYINNLNLSQKSLGFFKLWTQKEAYIKLIGKGFSYDTTTFNTLDPHFTSRYYTWIYDDYICSVCMETPTLVHPIVLTEQDIYNYFIFSS